MSQTYKKRNPPRFSEVLRFLKSHFGKTPGMIFGAFLCMGLAATANIINPLMALLIGVGLVVFMYGIVEFLWALSSGKDADKGKQHMLWGIIGMAVMACAYGLLALIANTVCGSSGDVLSGCSLH